MDNRIFYKMIQEVRQQCRFAQMAFQNLRTALNEQDPERVFLQVHALLGHAVMLSRLLWPSRSDSKARGDRLRDELKVGADSPLGLQGFRSQITGFDESFEDWLTGLEDPNFVDMNLMASGTMSGFKADTFQRSLDPDTLKLQLRGTACDLKKLNDEVRWLESSIQQWTKTHNPW